MWHYNASDWLEDEDEGVGQVTCQLCTTEAVLTPLPDWQIQGNCGTSIVTFKIKGNRRKERGQRVKGQGERDGSSIEKGYRKRRTPRPSAGSPFDLSPFALGEKRV